MHEWWLKDQVINPEKYYMNTYVEQGVNNKNTKDNPYFDFFFFFDAVNFRSWNRIANQDF